MEYRVDPIMIANQYGIQVVPDPLLDVDGMIEKKDDGSIIITYNNSAHPNRQRFTIAHELGHFINGHLDGYLKKYRDTSKNYSLSNYCIHEVEANRTAAKILMPEATLEYLIYTKGITDLDTLAEILEVSTLALHYRLKNLGWV